MLISDPRPAQGPAPGTPPARRRRLAILTACAGGFLAYLDTTIVNVAFPDIRASFPGATSAELSWVLDAYFIVVAALLVPAGGLADRIGRKRVFFWGMAIFTLASVACAAAPSLEALIAARIAQGVGAAVIVPVSLALILPEYPIGRRAAGVASWGAAGALAAASGPPLGGLCVELADWRWVFLVNLPIALAIFVLGRRSLTESVDENATSLPDLVGAGCVAAALGLLALGIVEGRSWGWGSAETLGALGGGGVLLGLAASRTRSHPRPVIDPELMGVASFRRANVGLLLVAMGFFSMILGNILFLTAIWGYSVLTAGLAVMPGALCTTLTAKPAGRLADRYGYRVVIAPGCLLYVAAILLIRSAGAEPAYLSVFLPAMVLTGVGLGLAFPNFGAAALSEMPADRFASATAVSAAFRQFGGVLGTAILFAIIGAPATLAEALSAADDAYLASALWALLAGVVALTLPSRSRSRRARAPGAGSSHAAPDPPAHPVPDLRAPALRG